MDDSATYDELPTSVLRVVNERCNRYEADRRAGRAGPLDDYLADLADQTRVVVRAELAALGGEYDQTPAEVPATIGGFDLVRCLGRGGMGAVYLARDPRLGRHVAVKVLRPALAANAQARDRFRREALAAGRLDHPHVVPALEAGEENGSPYLVSAYVEGEDLAHLVRRAGPVDPRLAIDYVIQAARGLAHAHERGIVHRDVKPGNLILGADGVVRVLDLGLARIRDNSGVDQTATGTLMGTMAYAAPEQVEAPVTVDARADVYGLGGVLHFLLTGRAPRPWEDFARLPGGLGRVVRQMLAVDPAQRPASMAEVIRLLESPPRPSRRAVLAAGTVGVLAASAGIVAYVWPRQRDEQPKPLKPDPPGFSPEQMKAAAEAQVPVEWTDQYGITFVLIPSGDAWVGTPPEEIERLVAREPDAEYHKFIQAEQRRVINIPKPFYLARTELTIGQMKAIVGPRPRIITEVEGKRKDGPQGYGVRDGQWVMEPNRSWKNAGQEFPLTDEHPAINLTWNDVIKLQLLLNAPGKGGPNYLVPDEEHWEHACLAGMPAPVAGGEPVALEDAAVYDVAGPLPVRSRVANPWGLYDMLGNLLEWCKFTRPKAEEPMMAPLRGGKFNDKADRVRPAARMWKPRSTPLGGLRLSVVAIPSVTGLGRMLGK